jgi:hypothetical protein
VNVQNWWASAAILLKLQETDHSREFQHVTCVMAACSLLSAAQRQPASLALKHRRSSRDHGWQGRSAGCWPVKCAPTSCTPGSGRRTFARAQENTSDKGSHVVVKRTSCVLALGVYGACAEIMGGPAPVATKQSPANCLRACLQPLLQSARRKACLLLVLALECCLPPQGASLS